MVTTLEIDKTLLQEALDLSNHSTPTTLIEAALREYIQRRKQLKILELFGTIDYDEDFDTPQPEGVGILGSAKPLNQSTLQCFNQRWDSPQA